MCPDRIGAGDDLDGHRIAIDHRRHRAFPALVGVDLQFRTDSLGHAAQVLDHAVAGSRIPQCLDLLDDIALIGRNVGRQVRHLGRHDEAEERDGAEGGDDGEDDGDDFRDGAFAQKRNDGCESEGQQKGQCEGNQNILADLEDDRDPDQDQQSAPGDPGGGCGICRMWCNAERFQIARLRVVHDYSPPCRRVADFRPKLATLAR